MSRAHLMPLLASLAIGAALIAPVLRSTATAAVEPRPEVPTEPAMVAAGAVHLTAEADRAVVLAQGDRRVRVRLDLRADDAVGGAPRVPTDLVIVVDRSGSMTGDKILDARAAALDLVQQLGAEDRFGLVSFASDLRIDVPLSAVPRSVREGAIAGLEAGGGTAMDLGLSGGLQTFGDAVPGRVRRMVLISDGMPDRRDGLEALARRAAVGETPLTTIGIGVDYDETLLQTLADAGTGNFHWVQRGPELSVVLGDELDTARETVASGVRVALTSDTGARIVDAGGYPVVDGHFDMGSLFAGQHRSLWVTLELPPGLDAASIDPGAFDVRWLDPTGTVVASALDLAPIAVTRDQRAFYAGLDEQTWSDAVVQQDYNDLRTEVSAALQQGDVLTAQAAISQYRTEVATMNAVVQSAAVFANLDDLDQLAADVDVQAANPYELRNQWAKDVSCDAYKGRRSGQSKSW